MDLCKDSQSTLEPGHEASDSRASTVAGAPSVPRDAPIPGRQKGVCLPGGLGPPEIRISTGKAGLLCESSQGTCSSFVFREGHWGQEGNEA